MMLRGRRQEQKDGAERENGKGREARGGASGSPPISPNDLGQPWRGAGAGPDAAQTRVEPSGPCLTGSGVVPRVRSADFGLRTLCGVRREAGGAVRGAENSPCPRGAMERRAAPRRAARCLDFRAGRTRAGKGGQGRPEPSPPRLRARSPCPAQSRSARTAAERMTKPERRADGGLGLGTAGTRERGGWTGGAGRATAASARGWGGLCVRPSVGPPTSLTALSSDTAAAAATAGAALARGAYISPNPGNDVIRPPLPPSPPLWGSGRSYLHSQPHLFCLWPPPLTARVSGYEAGIWLPGGGREDLADLPLLDGSTDLLCVRGQVTPGLWASGFFHVR